MEHTQKPYYLAPTVKFHALRVKHAILNTSITADGDIPDATHMDGGPWE